MTAEAAVPEVLHAWRLCLQAGEEARCRGDRRTGTDHLLLALLEDPSTERVLGVSLRQAREALETLDREALGSLGLEPAGIAFPPAPIRPVPQKPRIRDIARNDRLRMTPAAKTALVEAARPNRHKLRVTARQVLAQILTLQPPDPAAVLLRKLGVDTSEVRRRLCSVT